MDKETKVSSSIKKKLLIVAGFITLFIGIIGMVVPLLPTTPFLMLSAACFFSGSDRCYNWLMNHKVFGEYIRNYRDKKAISLKSKIFMISLLWITILYSIIFVIDLIYIRILLAGIAIAVTIHILHFKTLEKLELEEKQAEKEKPEKVH